jgi:hypothetical protein
MWERILLGLILILRQLDGDKQQTVIIKPKITLEGSNFFLLWQPNWN